MIALLWTQDALACAVCGGAGQNQQAFLDTMVFLSLMPIGMLGTFGFVVWRLSRDTEVEDAEVPEPHA